MNDQKTSYKKRIAEWNKAKFAPMPEPPLMPAKPTFTEMVPMRDGTRLYTEVFLPDENSEYPVVLIRSPYPYSRLSRNGHLLVSRYNEGGYAIVFQLTRGQGKSEGQFNFMRNEAADGYDTIMWLDQQQWCNGKVGMQGASYLGSTQLLAARAKPKALKCIMPTAFVGHFTRYFPFSCGVPSKGPYMQLHQIFDAEQSDAMDVPYCDGNVLNHPTWGPALRKQPLLDAPIGLFEGDKLASWRETISNPTDNEYWKDVHFTDDELSQLNIPIFFTDGWYDTTIGPIDFFSRLEKVKPDDKHRYLLVGPWDHYQTGSSSQPGEDNGDRILPDNGAINHIDYRLAFFDRYLKDDENSVIQKDRVRVYVTGEENSSANCWLDLPTFPAPGTIYKKLFLHSEGDARSFPSNGTLSYKPPLEEPVDTYLYDPSLPTPFAARTSDDRRDFEIRSDVLVYTSAPISEAMTLLGDIELILHASSDALDTDWFAVITEVMPNGCSYSFHYAPPAFRARYREGLDKEVLLTPHKPEVFRIPLGPAGHQIAVGNRLRLCIFSSGFPEYDPNKNTGNPAATDTDIRVAQQTIYHNADRPSHIIIPVIEL